MKPTKAQAIPPSLVPNDDADHSRRAALVGFLGTSALLGLAGCVAVDDVPEDQLSETEQALSGATVGWVDTIAPATGDNLRTPGLQSSYSVLIVKGYYAPGDGGGGVFHWDATSTETDDGGTIIAPTSTPTGRWKRLLGCKSAAVAGASSVGPIFSVKWFGAKGDGVTNDHAAINAAISALPHGQATACAGLFSDVAGGGTVFFPPGRYKTTAPITVAYDNITLQGCGNASTICPAGTFDTVVFQSATAATYIYGNRLLDLRFFERCKNGGRTVFASYVANFFADRVEGVGGYNGMEFRTFNSISLVRIRLVYYNGVGAYLRLASLSGTRSDVAWVQDCIFSQDDSDLSSLRGVDIDGFVHTVNLTRVGLGNSGEEALHVRNAVAAPDVPSFITAYDLEIEFSALECIRLDQGVKVSLASSVLHGSKARNNVYIGEACRNVDLTGGCSTGAYWAGLAIAGRNVTVASMRFSQNNQGAADYPGILVGTTSRGVCITGCRSGESDPPDPLLAGQYPGPQRYGIQFDANAKGFCVTGNAFVNNKLGAKIFGGGNTDFVFTANLETNYVP